MLYLFAAVVAATIKGALGKAVSRYTPGIRDCVRLNCFRMLLCTFISAAIAVLGRDCAALRLTPLSASVYLFSGVSMSVFLISWLMAVQTGAYLFINGVTTASVILPLLAGFLIFRETIGGLKLFGLALTALALYLLNRYNSIFSGKPGRKERLLLLVMFLSQGMISISQKVFTVCLPGGSNSAFNLYTFAITFFFLLLLSVLLKVKNKPVEPAPKKAYAMMSVMAVMIFLNSWCIVAATALIPSVLLFPISSVLSLAGSILAATLVFREKLNKWAVSGLALTAIALVLINL